MERQTGMPHASPGPRCHPCVAPAPQERPCGHMEGAGQLSLVAGALHTELRTGEEQLKKQAEQNELEQKSNYTQKT